MQAFNSPSTAILVFARSSNEELRYKPFAIKTTLFDALTERTLQTVKKSRIPFYHLTENQQIGDTFGARFTNAIAAIFAKGYDKIITVGNDSPHLSLGHLQKALRKLEQNETVIGPSADGGFYLLGIHRQHFNKSDFENLSWQSSKIKCEVIDILNTRGVETFLLPTLFDIDTLWDAQSVKHFSSFLDRKVLQAIMALVASIKKINRLLTRFINKADLDIPFNKGSPINNT